MNNNYNNINNLYVHSEDTSDGFYPAYHSPLIFDINTLRCYRKAGYVAWPKSKANEFNQNQEFDGNVKNRSNSGGYFAYPKNKS